MQLFAKRIRACRGYKVLAAGGLRLIPIPKGTLPTARRASVKELGGYEVRRAVGLVPTNNKTNKIIFDRI